MSDERRLVMRGLKFLHIPKIAKKVISGLIVFMIYLVMIPTVFLGGVYLSSRAGSLWNDLAFKFYQASYILKTNQAALANEAFRAAHGYQAASFDVLGNYDYKIDNSEDKPSVERSARQIPETIKVLDNKKVAVTGYMLPSLLAKDKVKKFILLANQMGCCFGVAPKINQWVEVTMAGNHLADLDPDVPLTVYGTLHVGEELNKKRGVISIYRMEGERVAESGERPFPYWIHLIVGACLMVLSIYGFCRLRSRYLEKADRPE